MTFWSWIINTGKGKKKVKNLSSFCSWPHCVWLTVFCRKTRNSWAGELRCDLKLWMSFSLSRILKRLQCFGCLCLFLTEQTFFFLLLQSSGWLKQFCFLKEKKKVKKPGAWELPYFHSYKVRLLAQIACPLLQGSYFWRLVLLGWLSGIIQVCGTTVFTSTEMCYESNFSKCLN